MKEKVKMPKGKKKEKTKFSYRQALEAEAESELNDVFEALDLVRQDNDMFYHACEFARLYEEKTGNKSSPAINVDHIYNMVQDELKELKEAKDDAEKVDALLDAVYYILSELAKTRLDIRPIWKMIHMANMTKFKKGHKDPNTPKWIKPKDFVPPDDDIRLEIEHQRKHPEEVETPLTATEEDNESSSEEE